MSSKTYYCNCYELTGKNPELNARFERTKVCEEKICKYCGHYAVLSSDYRHISESNRLNWDSLANIRNRLDETVLSYYYAEQARQAGKKFTHSGRGVYNRMGVL